LFYKIISTYFFFLNNSLKFKYSALAKFKLKFKPQLKFYILLKKNFVKYPLNTMLNNFKKLNKTNKKRLKYDVKNLLFVNKFFFNFSPSLNKIENYKLIKNNKFVKKNIKQSDFVLVLLKTIKKKTFFLKNFLIFNIFFKKNYLYYLSSFFSKRKKRLKLKKFLFFKKKKKIHITLFMHDFKFFIGLFRNFNYVFFENFNTLNLIKSQNSLNSKARLIIRVFIKKFLATF
jgi:hypothetical protein